MGSTTRELARCRGRADTCTDWVSRVSAERSNFVARAHDMITHLREIDEVHVVLQGPVRSGLLTQKGRTKDQDQDRTAPEPKGPDQDHGP